MSMSPTGIAHRVCLPQLQHNVVISEVGDMKLHVQLAAESADAQSKALAIALFRRCVVYRKL
jgi:hypothetical protein